MTEKSALVAAADALLFAAFELAAANNLDHVRYLLQYETGRELFAPLADLARREPLPPFRGFAQQTSHAGMCVTRMLLGAASMLNDAGEAEHAARINELIASINDELGVERLVSFMRSNPHFKGSSAELASEAKHMFGKRKIG